MATLYDTLGVDAHATDEEIKRAYRKAAMKWHPDRNSGAEDVARATFQEIKDAYAILSDTAQRKVYDQVYAEQMRGWQAQRARHQQAQAEREAAARAADEAVYVRMVSLAMRFADEGHNRDVVFGVLLGRQCDARRAAQIADSIAALQASRRDALKAAATAADASARDSGVAASEAGTKTETETESAAVSRQSEKSDRAAQGHPAQSGHKTDSPAEAHPPGGLGGLWFQFLNGLRF
ncbi:MAG TPA: J domain-containing protein [Paraburkholderia sp.]|nr:J domain-containing protein [Paraburkholderia sp.]